MKKNERQAEEVEQSTYRTGETRGKTQARKQSASSRGTRVTSEKRGKT